MNSLFTQKSNQNGHWSFYSFLLFLFFLLVTFFVIFEMTEPDSFFRKIDPPEKTELLSVDESSNTLSQVVHPLENILSPENNSEPQSVPSHIVMPQNVHGIYITGWTAGSANRLEEILDLFNAKSSLNTVVIDIKDASGRLTYEPIDSSLLGSGVGSRKISDLKKVIDRFHQKGVYVIGRIAVFQDPFWAYKHSEDALKDIRTGLVWKDYKNISWLNPNSQPVADYIVDITQDAYNQGFDEVNLDYVRFPSDGPLKYLDLSQSTKSKPEVMAEFFKYIEEELEKRNINFSVDLFGLTMSARDDLGIGQKLELIAPNVPIISPMVYPSHFSDGVYGLSVPAKEPYQTINRSLSDGINRLEKIGISKDELRPWLQDFDLLGIRYTPDMVESQIKAAEDLGINSWLLWDPANRYTKEAFTLSPSDIIGQSN